MPTLRCLIESQRLLVGKKMADVGSKPAADAPASEVNGVTKEKLQDKSHDKPQDKSQTVKPEKPDEEKFKADVAKAEKEHAAVMEKLVCQNPPLVAVDGIS